MYYHLQASEEEYGKDEENEEKISTLRIMITGMKYMALRNMKANVMAPVSK